MSEREREREKREGKRGDRERIDVSVGWPLVEIEVEN
jgi:hypothetical protein